MWQTDSLGRNYLRCLILCIQLLRFIMALASVSIETLNAKLRACLLAYFKNHRIIARTMTQVLITQSQKLRDKCVTNRNSARFMSKWVCIGFYIHSEYVYFFLERWNFIFRHIDAIITRDIFCDKYLLIYNRSFENLECLFFPQLPFSEQRPSETLSLSSFASKTWPHVITIAAFKAE